MSTIDPSTRLLAQIHALALDARQRLGARPDSRVRGDRPPASAPADPRDWLAQVARAVVAIEPNDPDRRRKAFRVYLQAILARECGVRQTDDQGFQALVDRVQQSMEADPRLRKAIDTAGDLLLQGAAG
jgi:hypothetical protein